MIQHIHYVTITHIIQYFILVILQIIKIIIQFMLILYIKDIFKL